MKHSSSPRATSLRPVVAWAGAAILSLSALFSATNAQAAPPPSTAVIGNQATANYRDASGASQLAYSNQVQTTVQQVGAFLLDTVNSPSPTTIFNSKTGAPGSVVYAAHTLTNNGNGADSFSIVVSNGANGTAGQMPTQVFLDANFDGLPDTTTPLCTAAANASCTVTSPSIAGNGGVYGFVVAYSIPTGATAPTTPYSSGLVTATPALASLYTAPNTSASDTDNVNTTSLAAFSATKSLSVPTVAGPANSTYPAATQSGQRSASAGCATTYAGSPSASSPAAGCVYSTYTIKFQNTGGAAGGFYLNDVLPAGFTYVTGSAVWSGASGVALSETGANPAGIGFQQSGQTLSALVANVNPSVASSISFMVLVNNGAFVGTGNTNNTASYDASAATHTLPSAGTGSANTNAAAFTVIATYGVTLGSSAGALPGSTDSTAGTPNGVVGTASADQNVALTITSGGSVKFTQKVFNTGNAADTFNMSSILPATTPFPAGTSFNFYQADGVTPLLDTNSDGIVDTGSIAAGGNTTVVVQATIPAATLVGAGPFDLIVRATSAGDSTKFDASGDRVNTVTGILVDLTNTSGGTGVGNVGNGDLGAGPSPSPTTIKTTPAGTSTSFALFVKNNDSGTLVFNLAASQTPSFPGSLPSGWTVVFGTALGCAAPITSTSVSSGGQNAIFACVLPPLNATPGTTNIYFKVTSTTNASTGVIVSDTKTDAVTVIAAATYSDTLTPNNGGQVSPGDTVVYAHNLTNTGAQACGAITYATTQSSAGWSFALFNDVNNNGILDAGDTPVTAATGAGGLAVGATTKILVKVFASGGALAGQQDTVVVTASFATANGGTCNTSSATDISTVVTGQIRAVKTQALDAACTGTPNGAVAPATNVFSANLIANAKPGQCVLYQVIATNEGTAAVTNLAINDAIPNYTVLSSASTVPASAQPASQCVASSGITGTPVYAAAGATVSCGSAANSVPPGATLQLTFAVKINN